MKRVNVVLSDRMYNELKKIAKERNMTVSAIIRDLIFQYILEVRATRNRKTEEEFRER